MRIFMEEPGIDWEKEILKEGKMFGIKKVTENDIEYAVMLDFLSAAKADKTESFSLGILFEKYRNRKANKDTWWVNYVCECLANEIGLQAAMVDKDDIFAVEKFHNAINEISKRTWRK